MRANENQNNQQNLKSYNVQPFGLMKELKQEMENMLSMRILASMQNNL